MTTVEYSVSQEVIDTLELKKLLHDASNCTENVSPDIDKIGAGVGKEVFGTIASTHVSKKFEACEYIRIS
jgi:hypothetical protein